MTLYRLTAQADLGVMFDAEAILYSWLESWPVLILKQRFEAFYASCPSVGFEIDGIAIGGAIYDGKYFHIAVLPAYYGRWGRLWQPTLEWLFSVVDPVDARIHKTNLRCIRFADHSGFPRIEEDNTWVTYRMSRRTLTPSRRQIESADRVRTIAG